MNNTKVKVAVVGGGIIGLSSAYKILQDDDSNQVEVTVIYEKSSPNTTGDVAAGWIYPSKVKASEQQLNRWFNLTCQHLAQMFKREDSLKIGVAPVSGFVFNPTEFELSACEHMMREATDVEKESFLSFDWREKGDSVYFYTTWSCRNLDYLPWLMAQIKELKGKFIKQRVSSFDQLEDFDIIVNCTGLGARYLVPDDKVYPVKGQVYTVLAPWIKHFYDFSPGLYILPRLHDVVVGGTNGPHDYSEGIDPKESERMWRECCAAVPSLKAAKIVSQKYGYRPTRDPVRLEMEDGRRTGQYIIHSYGHGGAGVTLHWGSATDVSILVQNALKKLSSKNSKL